MNYGPLCKAVFLLFVTAAVPTPQNQPSPVLGTEPQVETQPSQVPPSQPTPGEAEPGPVPSSPPALAPLPPNPSEYVRQAIDNEIATLDRDRTFWRYHLHREDEKNNVDRDVIETSEGSLARTLLMWG